MIEVEIRLNTRNFRAGMLQAARAMRAVREFAGAVSRERNGRGSSLGAGGVKFYGPPVP